MKNRPSKPPPFKIYLALVILISILLFVGLWLITQDSESPAEVKAAISGAIVAGILTVVGLGFTAMDKRQASIRADQERNEANRRAAKERKAAAQERRATARQRITEITNEAEEQGRRRREDRLYTALEYFTGHTQRRNVGISLVEYYWEAFPRERTLFVSLLSNQALYLLTESGQGDKEHEIDNLDRIIRLLSRAERPEVSSFVSNYRKLIKKLDDKIGTPDSAGLQVKLEDLNRWRSQLKAVVCPTDG